MSPPTPRRIQNVNLPTAMRGYDREATDRLLKDIGASYEEIWLERKALREEVDQLRSELEELREAHRLAAEGDMELQREADTIFGQAKGHAEELLRLAAQERERLESAMRDSRAAIDRIRSDLSALFAATLDRLGPEEPEPASEPQAETGERGELLVLDDLTDKRQRAQE
jgi:cell division initiation protein